MTARRLYCIFLLLPAALIGAWLTGDLYARDQHEIEIMKTDKGSTSPLSADLATTLALGQKEKSEGTYRFSLEGDCLGGWQYDSHVARHQSDLAAFDEKMRVEVNPLDKKKNMIVLADFPKPAGIVRQICQEREAWQKGRIFSMQVFVPYSAGMYPSAQLVAHHPVWGWFRKEPTRPLQPGRWTRVFWMLHEEAGGWESMESKIVWNDTIRKNLDQIGVRFYSDGESPTQIRLADMMLDETDAPLPELKISDVWPRTTEPKRGKRFEIAFDLSRDYENPFDPDSIKVDVDFYFHGPGKEIPLAYAAELAAEPIQTSYNMPAFYYQDFIRRQLPDGKQEVIEPRGEACWMARFTPVEAGLYSYRIRVVDEYGDSVETEPLPFVVADAPFKGFIRVDPKDHKYLSFDNGEFFYPIGLVVRSPWDTRVLYPYEVEPPKGWGTYAYDMYFKGMADAGMNFARVWMSSWWTALEWSEGYRRDYQGLGRYSLMNAWRQDYVMELAENLGLYLDVTLHNHGQVSLRVDPEWYDNPYYSGHGGPIDKAYEFWTDETSKEYVKKRLRYIIGRWGYSPNIAWFVLFNEVNLVEAYRSDRIRDWHKEMADYLKEIDPYKHLVSTHVTNSNFDPAVGGMPEIDIKQSNGYSMDQIESTYKLLDQLSGYDLPAYVNEFGSGNNRVTLRHNLHAGLWCSTVLPFLGPSLYWYWPHVHYSNEYYQFEALKSFNEGEDYRGLGLQKAGNVEVKGKNLDIVAQRGSGYVYAWIYDRRLYRLDRRDSALDPDQEYDTFSDARLQVADLERGVYQIEFWLTWQDLKRPFSTLKMEHEGGQLPVEIPTFVRDVACKIKPIGKLPEKTEKKAENPAE
ncbi:MAG: hypothetical protein ACLFUS_09810 [Candidatus Sumerlaeia bacterium]